MEKQRLLETLARMEAKMNSNHEKAEADRIADRECMKQMMARTDDQEDLKRMMKEMDAKMDGNQTKANGKQEEMLARIREKIESAQAEMRSIRDEWLMDLKDGQKETTACNGETEIKLDPGLMQSIKEHQDNPKGEAAVMPMGEPRKRRRVRNLDAERRQKNKGRTRENGGSRRKLAAACKKVSRRTKVAWQKRNLFRKIRIQENCEPWKKFSPTGIRMTHRAKVALLEGNIVRNKWTRAKAERGIQKVRTRHEGRKSVKDLGGGRPRYLRKRDLKKLRVESTGNLDRTLSKTTRLEIAERITRSTVGVRKIKCWALWRGRPPPKRKEKRRVEREPVM
jgi:hypothetical protein